MNNRTHSRNISLDILRPLLARSGNQCAYPNCFHPIFNEKDKLIAQLCHIEAVSPKGKRYNVNKTDQETNSYDNLLFLCYRHHIETDDEILYPVSVLRSIKTEHESRFLENNFVFNEQVLKELENESLKFWSEIQDKQINHIVPDFKLEIDINSNAISLIEKVNFYLDELNQIQEFLMNSYDKLHFEVICIQIPNCLSHISLLINQIELKIYENEILNQPKSEHLKKALEKKRIELSSIANKIGLVD